MFQREVSLFWKYPYFWRNLNFFIHHSVARAESSSHSGSPIPEVEKWRPCTLCRHCTTSGFLFSVQVQDGGFQDGCFQFQFATRGRPEVSRAEVCNYVRPPNPNSNRRLPVPVASRWRFWREGGGSTATCLDLSARRWHPTPKPIPGFCSGKRGASPRIAQP